MTPNEPVFSHLSEIGVLELRPLNIKSDSITIHQWVTQKYAYYWGMSGYSISHVAEFYQSLLNKTNENALFGLVNGKPSFLLEYYDAEFHPIAEHYKPQSSDKGLHILLAPAENPIKGFSYQVMRFVMNFLFKDAAVNRIVVEPDRQNSKIHKLNRKVGINHVKPIVLGDKEAYLGIVTRQQFELSKILFDHRVPARLTPAKSVENLSSGSWLKANRDHLKKCLSELSHEFLTRPKQIKKIGDWEEYSLRPTEQAIEYIFCAKKLPLEHWLVKTSSIRKYHKGKLVELDSLQFILEFYQQLNIPENLLATYLEEVSATLYSSAYKLNKEWLSAKQLIDADFQQIESAMSEGHPAFLANNGRIGFDTNDFRAYAPEAAQPMQYIWLAAHRARTHLALSNSLTEKELLAQEFDQTLIDGFKAELANQGLNYQDYLLIPVHPWQWFNKLSHLFAADIASKHLVCLGLSDDAYQSQQSIRTFFNLSNPRKHYIKTALSILNMGFMRGLSADYMQATPAINDWVYNLVEKDSFLQRVGFTLLKEVAAIGYRNPYFENPALGSTPYKKMLSALWRESPINKIEKQQSLMTMAGLLHQDPKSKSLLVELISASELGVEQWLSQYCKAYLSPLLHCFYRHDLVFM
ncbi:MAG: GNAT family N-acetyltransferase, partial [Kangiellaceae bacterium]|nr:GNAT family N-acetyltransferase [Kangiellaceae bacterium]